jgi:hypothetical protein
MLLGEAGARRPRPNFSAAENSEASGSFLQKRTKKPLSITRLARVRARQLAKVLASFLKRRASLLLAGQLQGHLA